MRRKQTAAFIVLLLLSSLAFVSQTRPQSPVDSTNPIDAQGGAPPATDADEDRIPDQYESIYSETVVIEALGGDFEVLGLDMNNGTDNMSDHDRDGAVALLEYCWPYTLDKCFSDRLSLTGKPPELTQSGNREYLDPTLSDTDGDGLPDGYEIHMCTEGGLGYLNATNAWTCLWFDPLDPSDKIEDIDRCDDFSFGCGDGFDVNRDGDIDITERYSNSEEYSFGMPENWVTERDGLWCSGTIPGMSAGSCQDREVRPTEDDGWLGTDPTRSDSDYYSWAGLLATGLVVPGDGIPDGWEAHYGLDPRNASDAIVDSDNDGWDMDRDGFIIPDTSTATSAWGEAFSNYEEYMIHYDDGSWVKPGIRATAGTSHDGPMLFFDQSTDLSLVDGAVHTMIKDTEQERILVGSKYGVTTLDPLGGVSSLHHLPSGLEMTSMIRWSPAGTSDFLIIGTNNGVHCVSMENGLPIMSSLSDSSIGPVVSIMELNTGSENLDLLIFGHQKAWTLSISEQGSSGDCWSGGRSISVGPEFLSGPLTEILSDSEVSANDAIQVPVQGRGPLLLVGTNSGLIAWNTTDAVTSAGEPWWVFDLEDAETFVRMADLLNESKSAIVNVLEPAGPLLPNGDLEEVTGVWIGTAGGLHLIDLSTFMQMPRSSISNDRMFNSERWAEGANDIHSILAVDGMVILGSRDGTWCLEGGHAGVLGLYFNQTRMPGLVTNLVALEEEGENWIFSGASPGRYMNIMPIDPLSSDSDFDGMPDGWEFAHGLDPTDPFDRERDADADGVSFPLIDGTIFIREWSNLEEFRYVNSSQFGTNGTDPRNIDSDGDGLTDGEEYWGWFLGPTSFDCHYLNDDYVCDDSSSQSETVHLEGWLGSGAGGGTDGPTDPTNPDSDGDGMPDGWEIENRRWIGDIYTGGNLWTLDPRDPNDADGDADGDGLSNLCEYRWGEIIEDVIREGLPSHGESNESALSWTRTDPNNVDSDGDTLPDGWEARYTCSWNKDNSGINPLNGSDALNNPDGDGYDINMDGILSLDEQFVNWLEYHLKDQIIFNDETASGLPFPDGFSTNLSHSSWSGLAPGSFGEYTSTAYLSLVNGTTVEDVGSGDPLSSDSDRDGMPDGWEYYHARWSLFEEHWTLNPVNEKDQNGDPDGDGMNNWEEYNSIDGNLSETDSLVTSPQFYLLSVGGELLPTPWLSAESSFSFGHFLSEDQKNISGLTADPNDPDTDGDGLLDGIELIFTRWNSTDSVWTLNPLVAGDGYYDSDLDGITDQVELNLTNNNPANGGLSPPDAPRMWVEADTIDPSEANNRVFRILFGKEGKAQLAMQQYQEWLSGSPAKPLLAALLGISDPNDTDTDRDGMSDGYEYWFTEWNLEQNLWEMNLLTSSDIYRDSDDDSYDCDGNGEISDSESFDNLAEYESRIYGKRIAVDTIPNETGLVSYGADAINAFIGEVGMSYDAAFGQLYDMFRSKSLESSDRMGLINSIYPDNFNISLAGVSDPTDADSDIDGMPDGWEFCYSIYGEFLPVNDYRWSLNPVNPLDVDYDPDSDGWFDREISDIPAVQGKWESRQFSEYPQEWQIIQGSQSLYFSNLMEYENGTHPLDDDSDDDSVVMSPEFNNGAINSYSRDSNLSDGREVFKYGTNPLDNDTDGDMMPDFYEYYRGWNETNDNWSSLLQISVVWHQVTSVVWKPVQVSNGVISRPVLDWTWFTHDPTDPADAGQDADNDGAWDCSSGSCIYEPYNNFQEYYGVVNASMSSPSLIRNSNLVDCFGEPVSEWWQLRDSLLGTCSGSSSISTNYFRMNKINDGDRLYALIVDDNDLEYENVDNSNDFTSLNGEWTDSFNRIAGDQYHLPNIFLGEYVFGWWILDIDGDQIADGTDPTNWDTDGDWLNDHFEIEDDLLDGIRGNSGSPIRYDDRST